MKKSRSADAGRRSRTDKARGRRRSAPAGQGGEGDIDVRSIERLIDLMAVNDLVELEVLYGPDRKIRLSRRSGHPAFVELPDPAAMRPMAAAGAGPSGGGSAKAPASGDTVEFVSPMVGSFYRAASPESPPYVTTGDKVTPETVLCIIEAMKVMNEIKAEMAGEVVDVMVENGEAVEFGQPLFLIRKTG